MVAAERGKGGYDMALNGYNLTSPYKVESGGVRCWGDIRNLE